MSAPSPSALPRSTSGRPLYGLLAEFDSPQHLLDAAKAAYAEGFRKLDACSPYPIEALWEAIGHHKSKVPLLVLGGGITGAIAGWGLQVWSSMIAYPMNIGGRPLYSWPAFIPPAYEMTILLASFGAVFGMIALNGLPRPHHPLFNVGRFSRVTRDGYFLAIEAADPRFDLTATKRFLAGLGPVEVHEVED